VTELPVDARLVPAALGAWLTAGLVITATDLAGAGAVVAGLGALGIGVLAARRRTPLLGLVALAAAAASLVCASVAAAAPVRVPAVLTAAAEGSRAVDLVGVVTGRAESGRLPVTVVSAEVEGVGHAMTAPILVFADPADPVAGSAPIGGTVALTATLEPTTPGDDVGFLAFPRGDLRAVAEPHPLFAATHDIRARFQEGVSTLPGPGAGLLPGLAVGDTSAVPSTLDQAMIVSSLSHLTAVSGANCAIVAGLALALAVVVGAPRPVRAGCGIVALAGFVVLVTPEPSVLRAAVMTTIALGAIALGRPARGLPLLCIAVVVLVALDPWLARSYGFALSVLATAGLLVLAGPLARVLGRVLPPPLAAVLSVPLAAQLACQPVILLLDPALPLYGVVANLLAAPAAPIATIVGLAACLLLPVSPPLGGALAAIAWLPASWIAAVATFCAGLPASRSPWVDGVAGVLLLVALEVVLLVALIGPRGSRRRRAAAWCCAIALCGYAAAIGMTRVVDQATRPADWQYAACEVGQGDAFLIRSAGQVALVDLGPEREPLADCLDDLGIGRIDLLVLTHFDLDHVGGVDAVLGRVDRVLSGPLAEAADQAVLDALAAAGARLTSTSRGETGLLGELRWEVLWPPPRGVEPGNDAGVSLLITPAGTCSGGCLSGVLLADLGEDAQARMLAARPLPPVDVVKVAHHGSADQSARLYETLAASAGLIGVGENDYGHPTDRLLDILAAAGTTALRSDLHGLVLVAPGAESGTVEVWTARGAPGPSGAPGVTDSLDRIGKGSHGSLARGSRTHRCRRARRDPAADLGPGASGPGRPRLGVRDGARGARHPPPP
jgi:competence protein ComEC